jgi:hypothetical protein
MANPISGLLMTVLAAADEASDVLQLPNVFAERIYWEHRPEIAQPYDTLRVVIPTVNEGNVVDIGAGPIQPTDYGYLTKDIQLNHNFSNSYVVKGFDQARISFDLRTKFFKPRFEEMLRRMNRSIISIINTTNFSTSSSPPSYTLFTGTGTVPNSIIRGDVSTAWVNLANAGVPMGDLNDVSLIVNGFTYGAWLADTNFTQPLTVGNEAAIAALQRATMAPMLGAMPFYDPMLPAFNAGKAPAVLMHRYAIAGVTANLPPSSARAPYEETTIMLKGVIPCRIQIGESMQDQGIVVNMNVLCGFAPGRPEMISLFQSAS